MRMPSLKLRLKTLNATAVELAKQPSRYEAADSWRAGKTSTGRGYGYKWQQARAAYLSAHPLCVMCFDEGAVTPATVVDHIEPHQGDQSLFWNRNNWQSLCATHHSGAKQRMERGG